MHEEVTLISYLLKNGFVFKIKTLEEFRSELGHLYDIGLLWDYCEGDVVEGGIELEHHVLYYVVGERLYETPYHLEYSF